MEGLFYRSYVSYEMYPITIHCKGFRYKDVEVLSAGFMAFGCDKHKVSAYIRVDKCSLDTIKELLEILDQNGNFPCIRGNGEFVHGAMIN